MDNMDIMDLVDKWTNLASSMSIYVHFVHGPQKAGSAGETAGRRSGVGQAANGRG